ncbi:MAG: hypothetical protein P8P73_05275 [Flavobacteriaceae bacterium]|nr:hypothetical protein [Flavobacteriaceae bacterium]
MQTSLNIVELINQLYHNRLYKALKRQLKKDFIVAGIDHDFDNEIYPIDLVEFLQKVMSNLIRNENTYYLKLLYVTDISENKISELRGSNSLRPLEQVTYFILRGEWQKVWYRNKYQKNS